MHPIKETRTWVEGGWRLGRPAALFDPVVLWRRARSGVYGA